MTAFRATGIRNGMTAYNGIMPGDLMLGGESVAPGAIATVGAGTWTGAAIATGIIRRTGPVGGYTDTTDTSTNILLALAGNNASGADVVAGSTFRLLFVNTVVQAHTYAGGVGVVTGAGTVNTLASTWREYLVTILNATPQVALSCGTTNASAVVTFALPNGMSALPIGPSPQSIMITPGMTVSGTGITAGTQVLNVTYGQGGITGVTLNANATATNSAVSLLFMPTLQIDGLRSGAL